LISYSSPKKKIHASLRRDIEEFIANGDTLKKISKKIQKRDIDLNERELKSFITNIRKEIRNESFCKHGVDGNKFRCVLCSQLIQSTIGGTLNQQSH